MTKKERKELLSICLEKENYAKLKLIAEQEDRSVSSIVRRIINNYLSLKKA